MRYFDYDLASSKILSYSREFIRNFTYFANILFARSLKRHLKEPSDSHNISKFLYFCAITWEDDSIG